MDWKDLEGLLIREFHPAHLVEHAQQWIKSPLTSLEFADPLISCIWIVLFISFIIYILNFITEDYGWTDRAWSLCPPFYAWFFALSVPAPQNPLEKIKYIALNHPRPLLIAVLITMWGFKHTYNFVRKGGFKLKGEDYRWKHVHAWKIFNIPVLGKLIWQLFSFGFIALYQNVLIFMFTSPAYAAYKDAVINIRGVQSLTLYDWILTATFLVFFVTETIADQQQWKYYERRDKYRALSKAEQAKNADSDEARGFNTSGLFAYSRHPNYFCEQCLWIVIYLFAVLVTRDPMHWTGLGILQLVFVIFIPSTQLTEEISASKYPAYQIYQKYVSRTIPSFIKPKINWNEEKKKN